MLYNRVKEHVVNDRKKMYKRGSQWVVVSAFALALGGVALTQLQPVNAAETDTHLVVQPVTLTQDGQVSQPAAAQTEPASAVKKTQPVATANAAKANGEPVRQLHNNKQLRPIKQQVKPPMPIPACQLHQA